SDGSRSSASDLPAQRPVRTRDCDGRGIGQGDPGLSPEDEFEAQLQRSWISNADAWTDAVREGRIPSRKAGTDTAILDAVRKFAPCSLLGLGCGEGWLARALSSEGYTVTGVDASSAL